MSRNDVKFSALDVDDVGSGTKAVSPGQVERRDRWGRKAEFVLACVGYAVGLGNVWRFPYLCFKSGGGAFLIPYFIMLFLCGIPLLVLEFGLGQYVRAGPVQAFGMVCPIFKGTGLATVMISFVLTTYYNVIIAWALFYLFASMQSQLPWDTCGNWWNTPACFSHNDYLNLNGTVKPNDTISSTEEYFNHRVLQITGSIDDTGGMRWELLGLLFLAWVIVYLCLFKGLKTSGKVVYFTATFPYIVLLVLFINGLMLEGSLEGIKLLFIPKWNQLLDVNVSIKYRPVYRPTFVGFGEEVQKVRLEEIWSLFGSAGTPRAVNQICITVNVLVLLSSLSNWLYFALPLLCCFCQL